MAPRVHFRRLFWFLGIAALGAGPLAAAPVPAGRPVGSSPAALGRGAGPVLRPGDRRAGRFQPGAASRISPAVNPVRVSPAATAPRR